MITDDIKNFPKQFEYEPEIINADKLGKYNSYVIGGMGGSGLVAGILRAIKPELDIATHHEYGLPKFLDKDNPPSPGASDGRGRLFIAISHSGNTEETLDFLDSAIKAEYLVAVISTGGKLIKIAENNNIPFIQLPSTGTQPRMSLGFITRAALKLIGEDDLYEEAGKLAKSLKPEELEITGKDLAETIFGKVPIIYSSRKNHALAYNWKIKFNETGKIPAFYNTFPELNHNEMQGFDVIESTHELSKNMHIIILKDPDDHPRILKRMEALTNLYVDRGLVVSTVELDKGTALEKLFQALTIADWTSYYTSQKYGTEPEQVPMIEEFKGLIA